MKKKKSVLTLARQVARHCAIFMPTLRSPSTSRDRTPRAASADTKTTKSIAACILKRSNRDLPSAHSLIKALRHGTWTPSFPLRDPLLKRRSLFLSFSLFFFPSFSPHACPYVSSKQKRGTLPHLTPPAAARAFGASDVRRRRRRRRRRFKLFSLFPAKRSSLFPS